MNELGHGAMIRDHRKLLIAATLAGRELLSSLYERQEGRCVQCGEMVAEAETWQVHHRHWRVYGGDDSLDNLELLHENCHRQKHSRGMKTK
jgi:RNA-directed DNA polymerase